MRGEPYTLVEGSGRDKIMRNLLFTQCNTARSPKLRCFTIPKITSSGHDSIMRLFSAAVHIDFGSICTLSLFDEASSLGIPTRVVLPASLEAHDTCLIWYRHCQGFTKHAWKFTRTSEDIPRNSWVVHCFLSSFINLCLPVTPQPARANRGLLCRSWPVIRTHQKQSNHSAAPLLHPTLNDLDLVI